MEIFISSPSDVLVERQVALQVVNRLAVRFKSVLSISAVLWEREPIRATEHFQDAMDPRHCDVLVCILWSRLGTPLPARFATPTGRTPVTGTEWEFETALHHHEHHGRPDILVYRKSAPVTATLSDEATARTAIQNQNDVDDFFARHFHDAASSGTLNRAFTEFSDLENFEIHLEAHLERLIHRQIESSKPAGRPISWYEGSPYLGLDTYQQRHSEVFFGRSNAISTIISQFQSQVRDDNPFLAILGMSGTGKSSLINAGLLPFLRTPRLVQSDIAEVRCIQVTPAQHDESVAPLIGLCKSIGDAIPEIWEYFPDAEALSHALLHDQGGLNRCLGQLSNSLAERSALNTSLGVRVLLIIDQLEELSGSDRSTNDQVQDYVIGLSHLVESGYFWCIVAFRSDFLASFEGTVLVDLMRGMGQYLVKPPTFDEIASIIREPAKAAGLRFEENETGQSLDQVILAATRGQIGALPLLGFCLAQLYEKRDSDHFLTFQAYNSLGGLEGAISRRADEALSQIAAQVNLSTALPNVLHALIRIDPSDRKSVQAKSLDTRTFNVNGDEHQIIQTLLRARLLISTGKNGSVEVRLAHEALITHWERLRQWVATDIDFLVWASATELNANQWREEGRISSRLLQKGKPLTDAHAYFNTRRRHLTANVSEFITESLRYDHKMTLAWRGGVSGTILVLLSLTTWAFTEKQFAVEQATNANEQREMAQKALADANHNLGLILHEKSKQAFVERNIPDALILSAAAYSHLQDDAKYQVIDFAASQYQSTLERVARTQFFGAPTASASDHQTLAVGHKDGLISLYKQLSWEDIGAWHGHSGEVIDVLLSPDGQLVASRDSTGELKLWDVTTQQLVANIDTPDRRFDISSFQFSPDSGKVLLLYVDGLFRIVDAATGELIKSGKLPVDRITRSTLNSDLTVAAISELDRPISIWQIPTGELLGSLEGHGDNVIHIRMQLTDDGKRLITGGEDNQIKLWDTQRLELIRTLTAHTSSIKDIAVNESSGLFASLSDDNIVRLWDLQDGSLIQTMKGTEPRILDIKYVSGLPHLSMHFADGTLEHYLLTENAHVNSIEITGPRVLSHALSDDGSIVAASHEDGHISLWDVKSGRRIRLISISESAITSVVFQNGTDRIIAGDKTGLVVSYDVLEDRLLWTNRLIDSAVAELASIPEVSEIVAAYRSGEVLVIDSRKGERQSQLVTHGHPPSSLGSIPANSQVFASFRDGTLKIWQRAEDSAFKALREVEGLGSVSSLSPDGVTTAYTNNQAKRSSAVHIKSIDSSESDNSLHGHIKKVSDLGFLNGGNLLVTTSNDRTAKIWDVDSGRLLRTFRLSDRGLRDIAISQEHLRFSALSHDNFIGIWEISSLEQYRMPFVDPDRHLTTLQERFGKRVIATELVPHSRRADSDLPGIEESQHGNPVVSLQDRLSVKDTLKMADLFEKYGTPEIAMQWLVAAQAAGSREAERRLDDIARWNIYPEHPSVGTTLAGETN